MKVLVLTTDRNLLYKKCLRLQAMKKIAGNFFLYYVIGRKAIRSEIRFVFVFHYDIHDNIVKL